MSQHDSTITLKQLEEEIAATQAAILALQQQPARKKSLKRRSVRKRTSRQGQAIETNLIAAAAAVEDEVIANAVEAQPIDYGYGDNQSKPVSNSTTSCILPHTRMNRRASYAANPDLDVTEFHRQQRQLEIQEMHRLHQEQRQKHVQRAASADDVKRESMTMSEIKDTPMQAMKQLVQKEDDPIKNLETEIAKLEAALAAAQQQSSTANATRSNKPFHSSQRRRKSLPPPPPTQPRPVSSNNSLSMSLHREQLTKQEQLEQQIQSMQTINRRKSSFSKPKTSLNHASQMLPLASPKPSYANVLLHNALTSAVKQRDKRLRQQKSQDNFSLQQHQSAVQSHAFNLAQLASQAAKSRTLRLDHGGQAKMTEVKQLVDYKRHFNPIVKAAAELGRLTRLNEVVIEAVAPTKTPAQEWKSQGLLAMALQSNHMAIVREAAHVGNETKLPEHVVMSGDATCAGEEDENATENVRMSERKRQLLELNDIAGQGLQKVDRFMNVKQREVILSPAQLVVRPMLYYQNLNDVVLPRERPPMIDTKKALYKLQHEERPMIDMARFVATAAWERRARLDRPNTMPKMKDKCNCVYCNHASPFQTYAYKVKEQQRKENGVMDGSVVMSNLAKYAVQTPRPVTVDAIDKAPIQVQQAKAAFLRDTVDSSDDHVLSSPSRRRFVVADDSCVHAEMANKFKLSSGLQSSIHESDVSLNALAGSASGDLSAHTNEVSPRRRAKVKGKSHNMSPQKSPGRRTRKSISDATINASIGSYSASSPRTPSSTARNISEFAASAIVTPDAIREISPSPPLVSSAECAPSIDIATKLPQVIDKPASSEESVNGDKISFVTMETSTAKKKQKGFFRKLFRGRKKK